MPALNEKQKRFADYYIESGNATESYKRAGYIAKGNAAEVNSNRLLRNDKVKEYIDNRNKDLENVRIASMTEVKEFWTNILRNEEVEFKDRLKASEYIAKTNAAFIEKVESKNKNDSTIRIKLEGDLKEWSK